MNNNVNFLIEIVPTWFSAFETVAAVIVAIFARPFREWWCRPKIKMEYNRGNKVCVEVIKQKQKVLWEWIKAHNY